MSASPPRLILASRSPIRLKLLEAAGLAAEARVAAIDERALEDGWTAHKLSPGAIAERLAIAKAQAVSLEAPDCLVIGADQTLSCRGRRLNKAATLTQARTQLKALRATRHTLHAGVALVRNGTRLFSSVSAARLTMRAFSDPFLERYLAEEGESILGSLGCYHYEERGIQLFSAIEGDMHTILGLPLLPLLEALRDQGYLPQ